MDGRIATWQFGAILGGVFALLSLVIVLVVGIALLRKYLHNKQRKQRHYSQQVEDGKHAVNNTSLSRTSFGVLWSLQQPSGNHSQTSSQVNIAAIDDSSKPHAFALATEPSSHQREDTIKVTTGNSPAPAVVKLPTTSEDVNESEEAVYYELENPSEVESLQLPTSRVDDIMRQHSSHSYSSISSDIQKLPPPPPVFSSHRRGRRHSLPNNLTPAVTQNTLVQPIAINNLNYVNCRYARRNSDPSSVSTFPLQGLFMPGVVSPVEYEKPLSSYMALDLSNVSHHSYTPLHIFNDTTPEPAVFPRQQLPMRTRLPINYLHMNSIPEENNYEKLNPLPKPLLLTSHDSQ